LHLQNEFIAELLTKPVEAPNIAAIVVPNGKPLRVQPGLLATTDRIRACRQRYYPAPEQASAPDAGHLNQFGENVERHDSALFDVAVEVDFYDGRRLRIPQMSTPERWVCPF
jgi:hypothetical protein